MGKYDGWDRYFEGLSGDEHELTFAKLEALLEDELPSSAYKHAPWWSNSQYHARWARHGWYAHADLDRHVVRFDRRAPKRGRPRAEPGDDQPKERRSETGDAQIITGERLVLVGCVAQKRSEPAPAKDLYTSDLWNKRQTYAESTCQPWAILSAEHGLVDPDRVIEPYDRYLEAQPASYREQWSRVTADAVLARCQDLNLDQVEIHAGSAYVDYGLGRSLARAGIGVLRPLRGVRIGEQLSWYLRQQKIGTGMRAEDPVPPVEPRTLEDPVAVISLHQIGPFDWRWPDSTESFDSGWEGECTYRGRRLRFRHGVGHRAVYGADRVHTVTWIDGTPTVEGVAADDYTLTRGLLSLIKHGDGTVVRDRPDVDVRYQPLDVVDHRIEIDAPYSKNGLAVKIRLDDVSGWLIHAVIRFHDRDASPPERSDDAERKTDRAVASSPLPPSEKRMVAQALAEFAPRAAEMAGDVEGNSFADNPEANRLLAENPLAFLLAVIADYQIPAERAWILPYLLKKRLGHLDPEQIVAEPDAVAEAVAERPSLHRYVNNVPAFFVAACQMVLESYDGDAGRIWGDEPTARELQTRLQQFPGISQKKAAMAVEILERDLGVTIREMDGSDIAYDVHIRRVFLRSGLADFDDQEHMIEAARMYWSQRPGELDLPSWVIGREWCRPRAPMCDLCAIAAACAQRVDAAVGVRGA